VTNLINKAVVADTENKSSFAVNANLITGAAHAKPIYLVAAKGFASWLKHQPVMTQAWLKTCGFTAKNGEFTLLPGSDGGLIGVLIIGDAGNMYALGRLPFALPAGDYKLTDLVPAAATELLALGWCLGADRFNRYKKKTREPARLLHADAAARPHILLLADGVVGARALVNTPAEDLGPEQLSAVVCEIARLQGAVFTEIVGDALLRQNFPAIHAVGRASHRAPRLLELNWAPAGADANLPLIVIVGKGVCFDTGGLDMKASDGMALMKKDMGGAAVAIMLAQLLMQAKLKVRLKLLVPAVENAVGPMSYRPGDVIATRAGLTVEIGNTDAEGRVVLCDALSYAVEAKPALILDFATLTGAARIALGPDLPATFSHHDEVVNALIQAGANVQDPLWRMPLWGDYQRMIDSSIADINNAGASRMAGAITAALYLERFVPRAMPWVHIDTYCWNDTEQPGRPKGGACQGLRAAFAYLATRFA
jgi:leucyl aminopeptidase